MRKLLLVIAILLFFLHQDWWLWNDPTIVLGIMPVGLAYHVGYSLAIGLFWILAMRYAWTDEHEDDPASDGGTR